MSRLARAAVKVFASPVLAVLSGFAFWGIRLGRPPQEVATYVGWWIIFFIAGVAITYLLAEDAQELDG